MCGAWISYGFNPTKPPTPGRDYNIESLESRSFSRQIGADWRAGLFGRGMQTVLEDLLNPEGIAELSKMHLADE
jgi:hypothetical protein